MCRPAFLILALLALPAGVVAQSLGDVAAQEKARRARDKEKAKEKGQKPRTAKSFTDDDLPLGATREHSEAPPPVETYVPSTPSPGPENAEGDADAGRKAEWSQRAAAVRQAVESARQAVSSIANDMERVRQDLNPMSLTFNPNDFNATLRLQAQLTELEAQLAAANQQVGAAEKAYQDFESEAQRNGVPSSWLQ